MHRLDLHWGVPVQIFTWPIIFIVVGLVLLLLRRGVGLLLIFIGAFFYFTNEFIWAISHLHEWWPVALIIVGVLILAKSTSAKRVNN
jgi:predicted membrane protein